MTLFTRNYDVNRVRSIFVLFRHTFNYVWPTRMRPQLQDAPRECLKAVNNIIMTAYKTQSILVFTHVVLGDRTSSLLVLWYNLWVVYELFCRNCHHVCSKVCFVVPVFPIRCHWLWGDNKNCCRRHRVTPFFQYWHSNPQRYAFCHMAMCLRVNANDVIAKACKDSIWGCPTHPATVNIVALPLF